MRLSKEQKNLIKTAKNRGYLTLNDFYKEYCSEHNAKNAIKRLCKLGILKRTENNEFIYSDYEEEKTPDQKLNNFIN